MNNKIKLSIFFILIIFFGFTKGFSKPIPPGSGEGDVPANILILLDSSKSMKNLVSGSNYMGLTGVDSIVELSDGNLIVAESKKGFVKILTANNEIDRTFAQNKVRFRGKNRDPNCNNKDSTVKSSWAMDIRSNDVIYAGVYDDGGKIVAFDSDGKCVDVIKKSTTGIAMPRMLEIREIGGQEILFVSGRTHERRKKRGKFYVYNFATGKGKKCSVSGTLDQTLKNESAMSMTIDRNGNYVYFGRNNNIWSFPLTADADNIYCPSAGTHLILNTRTNRIQSAAITNTISNINQIHAIEYSRDTDNIIYAASKHSHTLQKIELDDTNVTASVLVTAGQHGSKNDADPGTISAADVKLDQPGITNGNKKTANNLFVSSSSIFVGSRNQTIQKFDEDTFTSADKDVSWQAQYGGGAVTKFVGAKEAIIEIVSDSSLTSGANFGFGHWNAGVNDTKGKKAKKYPGETWCHKHDGCSYYQLGWVGNHPDGNSKQCNGDSCLNVGISATGKDEIISILPGIKMKFGTDANAFADIALGYFKDERNQVGLIKKDDEGNIDKDDCQINYVIVISDGRMYNETRSIPNIKTLRTTYGVKTLFVAYGGSYDDAKAKPIFDRFAKAGSCDSDSSKECEKTIVANTPQDLKVELQSKILQIIADRLSFTAPSITASIQEGGALYQAQFDYQTSNEWTGHLLRKAIDKNNEIQHDIKPPYCDENGCNWDAAEKLQVKGSSARKIWTALDVEENPKANYIGNWNNWRTANKGPIEFLFEETGNTVQDFHHTTSTCKDKPGVVDGNADDIEGLIQFLRGQNYYDYGGGCNLTLDRPSMLADIYNSQLIEVGAPSANTEFKSNNEEAYWRAMQGYSNFKNSKSERAKVIYAGSNDGLLHAFFAGNNRAKEGQELWAFIPPMIASKLPLVINTGYDGKFENDGGGTNAIFGVDGSPVAHDAKIYGLNSKGTDYETVKSWRTLLFVNYGRGGAGFSVLDVTNPELDTVALDDDGFTVVEEDGTPAQAGSGPLHMFSIFNDTYNKEVVRVDHRGRITRYPYVRGAISIDESEEAKKAEENQRVAREADGDSDDDFTERDKIVDCKDNDDYINSNSFVVDGTTACYKGAVYTFTIELPDGSIKANGDVRLGKIKVSQLQGDEWTPITYASANSTDGVLTIDFGADKTFNDGRGPEISDRIKIEVSCEGAGTDDPIYDYSQLGETWSTPRIFRIPKVSSGGSIVDDTYVAVMGGGMGSKAVCSGSGLYIVNLEDTENPGSLYGAEEDLLNGALKIIDSDPDGNNMGLPGQTFAKGSNLANSVPAAPVVITPDTAGGGIPWRGAMVYVNDLEGKITKINLTSHGQMFEQQTLINLNANSDNKRLNYFEMDATIGTSTNDFWLYGGTGDFQRISDIGEDTGDLMDNILYGVRDFDYPFFISKEGYAVPPSGHDEFLKKAADNLEQAPTIDGDLTRCVDTSDDQYPACRVDTDKMGWRVHLGIADGLPYKETQNKFRKASASPTVYRGRVYFPVYEPDKGDACSLGRAYVCAQDDECGSNDSPSISDDVGVVPPGDCYQLRQRGILSKLVVFGGSLFGNVAGPSDTTDTLIKILAGDAMFKSYRRSWRENY